MRRPAGPPAARAAFPQLAAACPREHLPAAPTTARQTARPTHTSSSAPPRRPSGWQPCRQLAYLGDRDLRVRAAPPISNQMMQSLLCLLGETQIMFGRTPSMIMGFSTVDIALNMYLTLGVSSHRPCNLAFFWVFCYTLTFLSILFFVPFCPFFFTRFLLLFVIFSGHFFQHLKKK